MDDFEKYLHNLLNDVDNIDDLPFLLNDREYLRRAWRVFQEEVSRRNNNDYIINEEQMEKLFSTIQFANFMVNRWGNGAVRTSSLEPRFKNGDVIVKCITFPVDENEMPAFRTILSYCSGFNVEPVLDDKVELTFTIPDVFKLKS